MDTVSIIAYEPKYKTAFRDLNEEWISKYFVMEEADYRSLDHPQEYIIDKGGYIWIALLGDKPVGAIALVKMPEGHTYDYELSKMGVTHGMQGKKIGWDMGQILIQKAKELGAKKIFLDSNRKLTNAMRLYTKMGFVEVPQEDSPYARSDIKMELSFRD